MKVMRMKIERLVIPQLKREVEEEVVVVGGRQFDSSTRVF
jgi:hypothetical protein